MRIDRIRFATAMARADLNGKQLGERAGVSRVTVSSVKSGKRCSKETALKLSAALGVNIEEILEVK